MNLRNLERYNFYKLENMIKEDIQKFLSHLDELLESNGIDCLIRALKASGITINIFNNKKQEDKIKYIIEYFYEKVGNEEKLKLNNLLKESNLFKSLYNFLGELRKDYFKENEQYDFKFEVVSYLISLEEFLKELTNDSMGTDKTSSYIYRTNTFESAIESTGLILKNFIYNGNPFKGSKRNISPKSIEVAKSHLLFSSYWNQLNDILEYWKYSDVEISKRGNEIYFEIMDDEFELNNHISNERFLNLREGWQVSEIAKTQRQYISSNEVSLNELLSNSKNSLNYLFASLYFGSPLLEEKINGIEIREWIRAYQLLIDESNKFLMKHKNYNVFNLEKVCLSKSKYKWKKFYEHRGFSKEDSEVIIKFLTFDSKSLDLIDSPFVEIDNDLIIIPSLTSQADASRALASNFLSRNVNLEFKGKGFEERTKAGLNLNGIINGSLYKRIGGTEYECDIAFILDNELFFVECKAHVQPYTTRQHANHLYKLYKETNQINRIADYYASNLSIVKEQLNLKEDFYPNNIHRVLLTTSMIGTPMFINEVYIIDESSFTTLIERTPPSLKFFNNKKGENVSIPSKNFDVFNGILTSRKMIDFLSSPTQIGIVRDFYKKVEITSNFWVIKRNAKVNQTIHIGENLSDSQKSLIQKHFGNIDLSM